MCMSDEAPTTDQLLDRAAAGEAAAWGTLLTAHQERLMRMVAFRMDPWLRGRIDAADVVQEAFVAASAHREAYFRAPTVPLFLWLRGIVSNKLLEIHRHHLGTRMRDAARDLVLNSHKAPDASSGGLHEQLSGHATGPGTAAARSEVKDRLRGVLDN